MLGRRHVCVCDSRVVFIAQREIARRGMEGAAATGGPTILDINSGFMRGPDGFSRIYPGVKFTQQEYET